MAAALTPRERGALAAAIVLLVAVRLALRSGGVECVVEGPAGEPLARRRVALAGENLALLPVRALDGPAQLSIIHAGGSGPLEAELREVALYRVEEGTAAGVAAAIAAQFERETGRTADPAAGNLVANADFAGDDEVRGTPADWLAYVEMFERDLDRLEDAYRRVDVLPLGSAALAAYYGSLPKPAPKARR